MILYQNSILTLDYHPPSDVLEVDYPDLHDYLLPEIRHSVGILVRHVRDCDIKRLLLDSRRTIVSVSQEESVVISSLLASGLAATRLRRLARLQSPSQEIERRTEKNLEHINKTMFLPFELRYFTEKAPVLEWLKS